MLGADFEMGEPSGEPVDAIDRACRQDRVRLILIFYQNYKMSEKEPFYTCARMNHKRALLSPFSRLNSS